MPASFSFENGPINQKREGSIMDTTYTTWTACFCVVRKTNLKEVNPKENKKGTRETLVPNLYLLLFLLKYGFSSTIKA